MRFNFSTFGKKTIVCSFSLKLFLFQKITMILEIFEKMLKRDSPPKEPIYYALKSFINSGSLEESILMKARVLLPPEAHNT